MQRFGAILVVGLAVTCASCGEPGGHRAERPTPTPAMFADSAERVGLPPARLRLGAASAPRLVSISAGRSGPAAPLPEPMPAEPPPGDTPAEGLAADEALRPPIPRTIDPRAGAPRPGWVLLDVRVDETGAVTDAEPAEADADSAAVRAAIEAALAMRFHPAVRAGRPVAVWCRQRFEVGASR